MFRFTRIGLGFLSIFMIVCCGNDKSTDATPVEEYINSKSAVTGSRIAWDYSSLRRISAAADPGYNGYARIIQLHDQSLIGVYESGGRVVTVKSNNLGDTWSDPVVVAAKPAGYNMAVPDILELKDKSLLVCYNPRPHDISPARKFGIQTKKSFDGGQTWVDERLVYEAGYQFENGCWEPAAIQLPSGEIQLYFANEGPYTNSGEQNISMLRSSDNGLTWTTEPVIVSFRPGKRDGMPSPLLLQNGQDVVVAIEDNGIVDFKPYIIRNPVSGSWANTVNATSPNRTYALAEVVSDLVYAGAPYIRQLKNGETIMSYQGTEGRQNKLANSEMKVVMGTQEARAFNRKTVPFAIPANKSGLWNSLSVLADNTVIALTSTNGFSSNGSTEVWMIKGHVIPELTAEKSTITVDGATNELIWSEAFPVFVGHKGATQVRSQVAYDDQFLYVLSRVKDGKVVSDSQNPEDNDGVTMQIDATNKLYEKPGKGIFRIFLSADNKLVVKEGTNGKWVTLNNPTGIQTSSKITGTEYLQEMAIPWALLGGKPALNKRMGVNFGLTEDTGKGPADYKENIPANDPDQPYTWLTLMLK